MSFCGACGASLPEGAKFCGECGRGTDQPFTAPATMPTAPLPLPAPTSTPPVSAPTPIVIVAQNNDEFTPHGAVQEVAGDPQGQRGRGGPMAVLGILGLIAAAVGIFLLTKSDDKEGTDGLTTTIVGATTIAGATTVLETTNDTTTDTTTAAITPPTAPPTDEAQLASEQLQQLITQDRPTADTLVGSWVAQLSAKRVGLKADGIEYGPIEILADHTTLRDAYGAIIVDAGAFQFKSDGSPMVGWFLTIVPQIYASKEAATQWCVDNGLAANLCLTREFRPPSS